MKRVVETKPTAELVVCAEGQRYEWWAIRFPGSTRPPVVGQKPYVLSKWKEI